MSLKVGLLVLVFVINSLIFILEMYRKMGSAFLGTCVRHVVTIGNTAERDPPFNRDEVILRIGSYMNQRDESVKMDISFDGEEPKNKLQVGACESLTLEKTFALPGSPEITVARDPVKAGFKYDEDDKSYTLWMIDDARDSVDLRNEYVLPLFYQLC